MDEENCIEKEMVENKKKGDRIAHKTEFIFLSDLIYRQILRKTLKNGLYLGHCGLFIDRLKLFSQNKF